MTENRKPPGFTLIEMLVAMALIATIVSMVYGSYAATTRSREIYEDRLTCSQRANLVLRLMARQIRCAYAAPAEPNATEPASGAARTVTETPRRAFYGNPRDGRGEVLGFVTTAGPGSGLNTPRGLAYVKYQYAPAAGTLSISQGPQEEPPEGTGARISWQPILEGVAKMEIMFHDGRQWQSEWTGQRTTTLPRAVRINLTVLDENDREHLFGTAVPIICRTSNPRTQSKPGVKGTQQ